VNGAQKAQITSPFTLQFTLGFPEESEAKEVLPTLKYATQKHYRYMLDVHLNPAFGQRQLRELTREELQSFLSRKLSKGLSWEPFTTSSVV